MKKTIRTVLIASLAVVVVGSAAVGTSVLRASEEADSDYAAEPVVEENNVTFVEVADEPEQPAEEPAAEPAEEPAAEPTAEPEEAEPAGEPAEDEEAEDPAEEPAEEAEKTEEKDAEKPEVDRSIDIVCSRKGAVKVGESLTLSAVLNGYDGCEVAYQWQISRDGGNTWENVPGQTGASYTFAVAAESFSLSYRVHVDVVSEPAAEAPAEAPAAEE